jgi:hypothetical protein
MAASLEDHRHCSSVEQRIQDFHSDHHPRDVADYGELTIKTQRGAIAKMSR